MNFRTMGAKIENGDEIVKGRRTLNAIHPKSNRYDYLPKYGFLKEIFQ